MLGSIDVHQDGITGGHPSLDPVFLASIPHLVEFYKGTDREKVAFIALSADDPDLLIAARQGPPLVVGIGEGENYIASDMGAIRQETDRVYVIDDDEVGYFNSPTN